MCWHSRLLAITKSPRCFLPTPSEPAKSGEYEEVCVERSLGACQSFSPSASGYKPPFSSGMIQGDQVFRQKIGPR